MENFLCVLCNEDNNIILHSGQGFKDDLIHVCICKNDGLVFLNPRMTDVEYDAYYKNEYDKKYFDKINILDENRFKNAKDIISRLENENFLDFNNILEIGPGMGFELEFFSKKFYNSDIFAIEKNIECKKRLDSLGVKICNDDLFETEHFNKKFDLIIINHVLEHVTNPIKFLKNIKLKLSDNGVIYIAVPNMFKSFGNLRKYWFRLPHIFYFSSNTLIVILNSVKLKPINIKSGFELYGIFKHGEIEMNKGNIFFKQYSYIKRKLLIQDIKSNIQKLFQFLISLFPKNIPKIVSRMVISANLFKINK